MLVVSCHHQLLHQPNSPLLIFRDGLHWKCQLDSLGGEDPGIKFGQILDVEQVLCSCRLWLPSNYVGKEPDLFAWTIQETPKEGRVPGQDLVPEGHEALGEESFHQIGEGVPGDPEYQPDTGIPSLEVLFCSVRT